MSTAITPLGPVQRPALEALAEAPDGLTVTVLAEATGCGRSTLDKTMRSLKDRGLIRVAGHQKRVGKAAAVYVITTTGLAALEAAKETA